MRLKTGTRHIIHQKKDNFMGNLKINVTRPVSVKNVKFRVFCKKGYLLCDHVNSQILFYIVTITELASLFTSTGERVVFLRNAKVRSSNPSGDHFYLLFSNLIKSCNITCNIVCNKAVTLLT